MRQKLQAPGQPGILPRWTSSAKSGVGLIVTDGRDFFSEEKRQTQQQIEYLAEGVPAFRLDYHLYVLLAPHQANHGYGNTAWVGDYRENYLR